MPLLRLLHTTHTTHEGHLLATRSAQTVATANPPVGCDGGKRLSDCGQLLAWVALASTGGFGQDRGSGGGSERQLRVGRDIT
jgi:hypothetical protein